MENKKIWHERKEKPEMDRKLLMKTKDNKILNRTYTECTPYKQLMYATRCVKWAYLDEVIKLCDENDKK